MRKNDAFVAKIVITRLTKGFMAMFAPAESLPSPATLMNKNKDSRVGQLTTDGLDGYPMCYDYKSTSSAKVWLVGDFLDKCYEL